MQVDFGSREKQALAAITAALPNDLSGFVSAVGSVDAPALLAEAGRHGMRGLVLHYARVAKIRVEGSAALTAADEAVQQRQRQNLDEAIGVLSAHRVPCVSLKGPLLGERLYPSPLLRPSTDLDLMVAERDFEDALRALRTIGYFPEDAAAEAFYREHHHHVHLHRAGGAPIELHHRAHSGFGADLPAFELVARAVPHGKVLVLSPEDEWLYLAVHAASHSFERCGWIYDLKLLARLDPALDWTLVARRAAQYGVFGAVSFARDLLVNEFGENIPDTGFRQTPNPAWSLYARSRRSDTLGRAASFALRLLLCDDASAATRLVTRKVRGRIATRSVAHD